MKKQTITRHDLHERLDDLRIQRNFIERTMSGLRPDEHTGAAALLPEWEEAMGRLARMHGGITDLLRFIEREESA